VLLHFSTPIWSDPAPAARAQQRLAAIPQFGSLTGPFDVNRITITSPAIHRANLHRCQASGTIRSRHRLSPEG